MPKTTNTFSKGMNLAADPLNQSMDSYSYALNVVKNNVINNPEIISNENGFAEYLNLGYEYILLGSRYLGKKDYILFIMNKDGQTPFNRILLVENGIVTKTVRNNLDLNFNSNNPITSIYRINYKNERLVYFVDGLNEDRCINIDIDTTSYNISLLSINTIALQPTIETTVLDSNGSLRAGRYFVAVSYNIEESYTTPPLIISNPVSIASEDYYNNISVTKDLTNSFGNVDGDILNTPTKKALQINLSNFDSNFTSYNLIVLKQDESSNSIRVVKNIPFEDTVYVYTGNEGEVDDTITLNDLIVSAVNYYGSEAIIQKDNRLLRGNSKLKATSINYQSYANDIKVTYRITEDLVYHADIKNGYDPFSTSDGNFIEIKDIVNKHSILPSYLANTGNNDVDNKTFMRDEIYSLGIGFELNDGSETDVFHIPGRLLNTFTDTNGVGEYDRVFDDIWDDDLISGQPRWKVKNTALKRTNTGELAYWRSGEVYQDDHNFPSNGEKNLAGKSYIRHHKMPSDVLEPIYRTEITGDPNKVNGLTTEYKIYKRNLGLSFSNIQIPNELKDVIKKIKIFYTPRDASNKSILSKGLIYALDVDGKSSNIFNSNMTSVSQHNKFEFVSPDVNFKFKETNLSGSKIKVCGIDKGYTTMSGGKGNLDLGPAYYVRLFNDELYKKTDRRQALISNYCFYNQRIQPKEELYNRDLNRVLFVDSNYKGSSDIGNIDFMGAQNTAVLELTTPLFLKPIVLTSPLSTYYPDLKLPVGSDVSNSYFEDIDTIDIPDVTESSNYAPVLNTFVKPNSLPKKLYYDTSYYIQIVNEITNLYGNIKNLKYIPIGSVINYNNESTINIDVNGGDTVIDVHHFRKTKTIPTERKIQSGDPVIPTALNIKGGYSTIGAFKPTNFLVEVNEIGIQCFGSFFCETDINIRMRREGTGDDEKYFPKSYMSAGIEDYKNAFARKEFYKIDSVHNNNNLKLYFINYKDDNSIYSEEDTRYSTRIIYSDKQNLEDKTDNYRRTRANNYKDLPLDKGGISIFFINKDKLYTITRDTVYNVFTSNQTLQTLSDNNITVGTGEFLGSEPIDLLTIDGGYAGCSSKLSFVESPYGYLFVDRYKGKVMLFNESLEELSIKDVSNFISENYDIVNLEDSLEFDKPLKNIGYVCGYDANLKRFLITKLDKGIEDKSFTMSYCPISKQWISMHSYLPNNYIVHPNSLLVKNNDSQIKEFNKGIKGIYFTNTVKPFIIEVVFNDNPDKTKVFDSISTNVNTSLNDVVTNKFFNNVVIYNDLQSSGTITFDATNLTKHEKDWSFNKFLDLVQNPNVKLFKNDWVSIQSAYPIDKVVNTDNINLNKPWYLRARFRDKYIKVRFIGNNLDNNNLNCKFVSCNFRISQR